LASFDLLEQLDTVHSRHLQVRKHEIDLSFVEHRESLGGPGGRQDLVALASQGSSHCAEDPDLVIDDQHDLRR